MARVLLDHVQVGSADFPGALRVAAVARHDIIRLLSGHGSACVLCSCSDPRRLAAASASSSVLHSWPVWSASYGKGMSVLAAWMRNHQRSTSVMCCTRPGWDRRDGGTARSFSWPAVRPAH